MVAWRLDCIERECSKVEDVTFHVNTLLHLPFAECHHQSARTGLSFDKCN